MLCSRDVVFSYRACLTGSIISCCQQLCVADPAPLPCAGEQLALFVGAPQEDKDQPGSVLTGTLAIARDGGDSSSHAPGALPLTYLCAQPGCVYAVHTRCDCPHSECIIVLATK